MKSYTYCAVLIAIQIYLGFGQLLPEGNTSRVTTCEGTILRGSCPADQVIAVKDIEYGTTNCTLQANDPGCCDYDPTDCLIDYTGTAQQAACSGRGLCNEVTIGEEDTSSCGSPYPDLNHYLTMEFYCIPKHRIGKMCDSVSLTATGSPLYIWNNDYPAGHIRTPSTSCSCSVEASSCSSKINVYFVHFELADGGGSCSGNQNIQIDDKGSIQTFTCSQNNNYEIITIMSSSSNYIIVTLDNAAGTSNGKFWIAFEATDNNSHLKVSCPAIEQTICNDCPVLTPPTSGSLSTIDVTTGTSVKVACDTGYALFGGITLECQTNGAWSAEVGTCQKGLGKNCTTPSDCSAVEEATCKNNICACIDGHTTSNNECIEASSGGLGDSCTNPMDCSAVSNATCTNNVCACVDGYTQSNNGCKSARSGVRPCSRCGIETLWTFCTCTFVTAIFIFVLEDSSI